MRVSEVLRQLADLTAGLESGEDTAPEPVATVKVSAPIPVQQADTAVQAEPDTTPDLTTCDNTDNTEPATMISPQQQELELLKKSQGVENNVSEFAVPEEEDAAVNDDANKMVRTLAPDSEMKHSQENDGYNKELAAMKQAAGIGEETGPHNYAEDLKPVSINPRAEAAKQFHKSRRPRPE